MSPVGDTSLPCGPPPCHPKKYVFGQEQGKGPLPLPGLHALRDAETRNQKRPRALLTHVPCVLGAHARVRARGWGNRNGAQRVRAMSRPRQPTLALRWGTQLADRDFLSNENRRSTAPVTSSPGLMARGSERRHFKRSLSGRTRSWLRPPTGTRVKTQPPCEHRAPHLPAEVSPLTAKPLPLLRRAGLRHPP